MAGIYFHIPFCKQACNYCDFHFATTLRQKAPMVKAMMLEMDMRKNYLGKELVETIYFGGGTPSLLTKQEIELFLRKAMANHTVAADAEITLEANPDDITLGKLHGWKEAGINRLSIGIQSFRGEDLQEMNRAHNENEALKSVALARDAGFENITIDLIYGLPFSTDEQWKKNIQIALNLNVPHISAYGLTIEPQTNFGYRHNKGTLTELPDEVTNQQFSILMDELQHAGYEHYEISNFAKPGNQSRHNSAYWQGKTYLAIGPSAHGYNGHQRYYNIANNRKYISSIEDNVLPEQVENLTISEKYNDYILTRLRTSEGISLEEVQTNFGDDFLGYILAESKPLLSKGLIVLQNNYLRLTREGKFLADFACSSLFHTDEIE